MPETATLARAAVAALALCAGTATADLLTAAPTNTTQAERTALAQHAIGINMAFYEAQRAGNIPADSATLFPNIWEWKKPGYENVCSDFVATLPPADRAGVDFPNKAGYYEAGNAVLVTGPSAFAVAQISIGALQFFDQLAALTPKATLGDPAGCFTGGFSSLPLSSLLLRQLRYEASVLANSIMVTRADNSDFKMLIGVADSSTYGSDGFPSWETPAAYQQKCYIADLDNPAADVAGQAAAGLAMAAKALATHGNAADQQAAAEYGVKAARAYEYAKLMWRTHGVDSICSRSAANSNCIGSGCTEVEDDGDPVRSPCELYYNQKPPNQYLFVASAALYALTGDAYYRGDADSMWPAPETFPILQTYLYNWNNVITQGVVILAMSADQAGAARPRDFYRDYLRSSVGHWAQCSNEGVALFGDYKYCERTPDGSAYPLDMPWGNMGTIMNGMCAVGTYHSLGYDAPASPIRKAAACTMQRQLGYVFNHKCDEGRDSSCNTPDAEGFSYMVGIGKHWPTMLHSRDAAFPYFYSESDPDPFPLCGALVSGPYAQTSDEDGPVVNGTDTYTNNRRQWKESEPAIDYTSSLVCTLMAYATMPDSLFEGCAARSPFTGRATVV